MNKMTPMILVMLMLTSVLASIDIVELQEMKEIEDTNARAEADPEVVVITSPRETTCTSSGSCTDELLSGIPVNFKAYLRNSGDADLTNMQYQVTVYTDVGGTKGDIAKDSSGNDLAWDNANAVCNFATCQETSVVAGDFVGGGELTLKDSAGSDIVWNPSSGNYIVIVSVTSSVLGDPGNDELGVAVTVRDYYDVAVELTWVDAQGNDLGPTIEGDDVKNFKISVSLDAPGMANMTIRNATVAMVYSGVDAGDSSSFMVGVNSTVDTRAVDEDPSATETGWAYVVGDDGNQGSHVGQTVGSISPSTASSATQYSVTATLTGFTIYDYHTSCGSGAFETIRCEKSFDSSNWEDEYTGSNTDTIEGATDSFHDASLYEFQLISYDDVEDTYDYYGGIGIDITSSLSPGDYILYSEVGYDSSSLSFVYDWNMSYTVTGEIGTSYHYTDNCTVMETQIAYKYLGMATSKTDADMLGEACVSISLSEGAYSIEAQANILGQYMETTETLDTKVEDMSLANNRYSHDVNVENFAPQILSLTASTKDPIFGQTIEPISITAEAFDVEGDQLIYTWTDSMGNDLGCDSDSNECFVALSESMVPTFEYNLEVMDIYGASDSASGTVSVWNLNEFTSTGLDNGLTATYSIVYKTVGLGVGFDNATLASDVSLPGFDGTYSSVGAVTFTPSTTYDVEKIDSQTVSVEFGNDLGATSMWVKIGNLWQLLAEGTPIEVDATTSAYTFNWGSGTAMLGSGSEVHLFGGQLTQDAAPSANISGFAASASKAGGISISWTIDGTMLSDDRVVVNVCETDANCASPVSAGSFESGVSDTLFSGQNTVHGTTYHVSAAVCNGGLCSNEATGSVVADKEVAAVTATGLTIAESGETWVLDWNASSEDSDIASWLVCYMKASFSASDMSALIGTEACVATATTDATINQYTTAGTYDVHFAVVPVDVVGNTATAASSSFIEYSRDDVTTNPDDGSQTTDTEASSGVPTWTWGVIGVVVVAAFVVGAFILSRGDDGDDENKEWDY
ncbi:MAG: hypothetical protein CBE08_000895 [Euryarchaeota archaeon TMED248]|nr:MAG: hypothetical protein CBE08_000895 [Euryarchaeota archaeon TMED248]|tara:strand:- start:14211 stop:17285 length:3075 start_codon:yes stop_codon:yes gene_type:complete